MADQASRPRDEGDAFVSLLVEDGVVIAHTYGELYGLDAESGRILWQNELDGLGYDFACLATETGSNARLVAAAARRNRQEAAAAAAGGAGGGTGG